MKLLLCGDPGGIRRALCQFLLVADMLGNEAFQAVEFIMMVANIQTLGVPVAYSSMPGVISAVLCGISMPLIGLITNSYARSKYSKAIVLVVANSLLVLGGGFVFFANTIELFDYTQEKVRSSYISNISMQRSTTSLSSDIASLTINSSQFLFNSSVKDDGLHVYSTTVSPPISTPLTAADDSFPVAGALAIVGYALIDAGYDISNCFLKTFLMEITPPEHHPDIFVKSIFVGSFGGCLITMIGSLGIGKALAEGTSYDVNATECAFLAAVCVVIVCVGLSVTLITGLCWNVEDANPSAEKAIHSLPIKEEKSRLLAESSGSTELHKDSLEHAWSLSQSSTHTLLEHSGLATHQRIRTISEARGASPLVSNPPQQRDGWQGLLMRNRLRIFLCLATFLSCGAHYSFNMYSVNFVGVAIFQGDPSAPVDAPDYAHYLQGMQAGSLGFTLLYLAFVMAAVAQSYVLKRHGWWLETVVGSTLFIGFTVTCVFAKSRLVYYCTAFMNGVFRALVFTVPYVLVDRIVKTQQWKGQTATSTQSLDIVLIAAMWPCAFAVCAGLMGPLLDWSGDVATPLFYSVTTAFLGTVMFAFVRRC